MACSSNIYITCPESAVYTYPNFFITRRFVPYVLKRVKVRYLELGLGSVLMLGLDVSIGVSG